MKRLLQFDPRLNVARQPGIEWRSGCLLDDECSSREICTMVLNTVYMWWMEDKVKEWRRDVCSHVNRVRKSMACLSIAQHISVKGQSNGYMIQAKVWEMSQCCWHPNIVPQLQSGGHLCPQDSYETQQTNILSAGLKIKILLESKYFYYTSFL